MPTLRDPVHTPRRFLVLDRNEARADRIALRARLAGHVVDIEEDLDRLRHRLLRESWDAIAIELVAGSRPTPFSIRTLQQALRSAGVRVPPIVVFVPPAIAARREAVERAMDAALPGIDRVLTDDPELLVRALGRLADGTRPAAIPVEADGERTRGEDREADERQPVATVSVARSRASNWSR